MKDTGIAVKLDELSQLAVADMTKYQIASRLADAYTGSEEYKELLSSIKVEPAELKELVINRMVEEIIDNWRRNY